MLTIEHNTLQQLLDALRAQGYRTIGPREGGGAPVLDDIASVGDLPVGRSSDQAPGRYRYQARTDGAVFGCVHGPHSWKQFLHPPLLRLQHAYDTRVPATRDEPPLSRLALVGVRPCDLEALDLLDHILGQGPYAHRAYTDRRAGAFIVAVNCSQAGGTCFCASLGSGPRARGGYDLALTEVIEADRHFFTVEVEGERAREIMRHVAARKATDRERELAARAVARAEAQMGRSLDTHGLATIVAEAQDDPEWEVAASKCLACSNCTMVCPTCFCTSVEETSGLSADGPTRWRKSDSCFRGGFRYIDGAAVPSSATGRYRHWVTHKFSGWVDEFGRTGCVGCGRCITWCPVGIDITGHLAAIRARRGGGTESTAAGDERREEGS